MNFNRKDWFLRFNDVFWVYRTVYKILLGMLFYRLVYGKFCYLSVEIEYKVYWVIKVFNLNIDDVSQLRKL